MKDRSNGETRKKTMQLLFDLKERRPYWKLQEEAPDRTVWRTGLGKVFGPVVRQNKE